ncbi:sigma-70 family RNA polymerase sigma factor [Chitinophaga sp. NPDC101104]|uniref:sigma-70 family RNA polymerase sigma factor n=1 Tax=Chitinophaga sp. NPDC101104 TaxID=3390561 RepID=UPI003D035181
MPNNVVDISATLQDVSRGDENAFRDLFRLYADHLYAYIWQLTKSRELAEEVVQDIFLQIWISREALAGVRNFRNYLFVIARNHALNAIKKMMRERKRAMEWELARGIADTPLSTPEPDLDIVEEAIRQLPSQQQKAWLLSRRQGKKYHEIAREMQLSRETVKKYIQYATQSIVRYVTSRTTTLLAICILHSL